MLMNSSNMLQLLLLISTEIFVVNGQTDCWSNAKKIFKNERKRNTMEPFTYIICNDTTFESGVFTGSGFEENSFPLLLKSNSRIQCGDNGDPSNNCIVDGTGSFGLLINPEAFFGELEATNIEVKGLTFRDFSATNQMQNIVTYRATAGSISFESCIFEFSYSEPMFEFTQFFPGSLQSNNDKEVNISITDCRFKDMGLPEVPKSNGGLSLLHFSGTGRSVLVTPEDTNINVEVKRTIFDGINTISKEDPLYTHRSLIDFQSVGELTLDQLCFRNVQMSTNGASDFVIMNKKAKALEVTDVYIDTESVTYTPDDESDEKCSFMSLVEINNENRYERTGCGPVADANYCSVDGVAPTKARTNAPTKAPNDTPIKAPTDAPTKATNDAPTNTLVVTPTITPTSINEVNTSAAMISSSSLPLVIISCIATWLLQ